MNRFILIILVVLIQASFPTAPAYAQKTTWLGTWKTQDSWGSDYTITLYPDGKAFAQYANGIHGNWKAQDGGIAIEWQNKTRDFIFHGVMGRQRLFTKPDNPDANYNAGITKTQTPPTPPPPLP